MYDSFDLIEVHVEIDWYVHFTFFLIENSEVIYFIIAFRQMLFCVGSTAGTKAHNTFIR